MKIAEKSWTTRINAPLEEVCSFFSSPENLNVLTPDDMSFEILSDVSELEMYLRHDHKVQDISICRNKNELGNRNNAL